ncbi:glycosyltransferase family 2 protein [Catenuloplanes indicus]|uniref:Glycosyltransferase involved in cell wall biosynthesis n=1 Tax=Catenuloplanes indicus TaxID=137267 RepID=A0AAE3VV93_9ACTN|nr:glycosyltransferase family 2 protein [Catenuloplanes indicus]MDQ0363944.1 glycosyltransferase involved in cell wall biosynthesis [Catenuloplanes indicus]
MVEPVAVIVPNFNKAKTLRACLTAIAGQSYRPVEVVVVDDCSTDGSADIAREFDCRLVEMPVNGGPAAARNEGVRCTTAPLLFFVDSDTAPAPDAIANAVRLLGDDVGMVQGIYEPYPLFDDGPVEAYRVAFEHFWRRRAVGRETGALLAASLIRRSVFEEAGGLDERLRDGEDDEFGTRLPARYRLIATDRVLTRHDDEERLGPLLAEQFTRARTKPALMARTLLRQRDGARGARVAMMSPARFAHLDRSAQVTLAAALLVPVLPPALPLLCGVILLANHEFLRFAYRLRGVGFMLTASGIHLLAQGALVCGLIAGLPGAVRVLAR